MATPTPDEIWKILNETARDLEALKNLNKERDEERAKRDKERAKRDEERAREQAERDKERAERDRRWDEFKNMMGNFVRNAGEVHEEFFFQAIARTKRVGGIDIDRVERNIRTANGTAEIDLLWFNSRSAGIVEVKQKAHPNDIDDMLAHKVAAMKRMYPDYAEFYFGIATMVVTPALEKKAREAGVFLLTQGGENIKVVNDKVRAF